MILLTPHLPTVLTNLVVDYFPELSFFRPGEIAPEKPLELKSTALIQLSSGKI